MHIQNGSQRSDDIPSLTFQQLMATQVTYAKICRLMWLPRPLDTGRVEEELFRNAKRSGLAARCFNPCTPQISGSWLTDWHGGDILHPNRSRRGEPGVNGHFRSLGQTTWGWLSNNPSPWTSVRDSHMPGLSKWSPFCKRGLGLQMGHSRHTPSTYNTCSQVCIHTYLH